MSNEERDLFWDNWRPQCFGYGQREFTHLEEEPATMLSAQPADDAPVPAVDEVLGSPPPAAFEDEPD